MKHKKKRSKLISFDAEIITKQTAEVAVNEKRVDEDNKNEEKSLEPTEISKDTNKNKQKRKKQTFHSELPQNEKTEDAIPRKKNKRNQKKISAEEVASTDSVTEPKEEDTSITEKPAEESIRSKKRKKHAKLLEEKKLKTELAIQQKCLNYLSLWKHNKDEWKFEKLRQVWLQQNMYNTAKIPDEFWDVLVQYFSSSKGKARNTIIQDAIKVVEKEENETNEDEKEDFKIKVSRARDIIQNLQE